MKATKITNVNLVVNHFLKQELWRCIFTQFMMAIKITSVNLVVNHFLKQAIWRDTYTQFIEATKISINTTILPIPTFVIVLNELYNCLRWIRIIWHLDNLTDESCENISGQLHQTETLISDDWIMLSLLQSIAVCRYFTTLNFEQHKILFIWYSLFS